MILPVINSASGLRMPPLMQRTPPTASTRHASMPYWKSFEPAMKTYSLLAIVASVLTSLSLDTATTSESRTEYRLTVWFKLAHGSNRG